MGQLCTSSVPSIIDIIGCDITIEDIQSVKKELVNQYFDLKKEVNNYIDWNESPLTRFCRRGNLLIVKLLFLIGADCTKLYTFDFPMLAAAHGDHLDICQWLFEYGGNAKDQVNKELSDG